MTSSAHDILQESYQLGQVAESADQCPYRGGTVRHAWFDGFVAGCVDQKIFKPCDRYTEGRIAFRLGMSIDRNPDGDDFAGRWVSGWLSERQS